MPPEVDCPIEKMRLADLNQASISAFQRAYEQLCNGDDLKISEESIRPVYDLNRYEDLPDCETEEIISSLQETVIIKLNGGMGTGMGLEKVKSLLPVREGINFLDVIVKQLLHLRSSYCEDLRFLLMNSFSTSDDTKSYLSKYPDLGNLENIELMQNRVPKIRADNFASVNFPDSSKLEWCPPGHGDIYSSLLGTGLLDKLLNEGVRFAFISNSDNLGATFDFNILNSFKQGEASFLMEVTQRTEADKKGGHLARGKDTGSLILREIAQCEDKDTSAFQDISKHRYFNTNNIWIRLDALKENMMDSGGVLELPIIRNHKTVDPTDSNSLPVYQLEIAMGAAIQCFKDSVALSVPRSRFAPVKTSEDLFALQSDAYSMTEDFQIQLIPERHGIPPIISLDDDFYARADQLNLATQFGVPSLLNCKKLQVEGPVVFNEGTIFQGSVVVRNSSKQIKELPAGEYNDEIIELN
ncbi:MAG TPA: UTP--glucose-1-phosphate uridylyltransferase [Verrucomicrobia bacterium]|nr:UTP--glucose-1-phosphate uridylyltransferase [Verrucomicrobiales bacterium]HIL54666.1 UTP--glucose-1-phosphate uridylyltransferase [Verrucomicrobiota bacterium]